MTGHCAALTNGVAAAMVSHARQEAPRECCGLLLGDGHHVVHSVPARNIAEDPTRRYKVDPRDHLAAVRAARLRSLDVIGAYHSHPRSAAIPSPTDAAEAFGEFLFVIIGLAVEPPDLTAWGWNNGNFMSVPLVRFGEGQG
ncbi:MAG: M67 family metallopeptidase [Acidobacteria bacterium]|nr:M67 family metallopeptidase [Acidobacteriota bacterium]